MDPEKLKNRRYLGDGLYAGHDDYQIILYTERYSEGGLHWVAMDTEVLDAFYKMIQEWVEQMRKENEDGKK